MNGFVLGLGGALLIGFIFGAATGIFRGWWR